MEKILLEMQSITKEFPGVRALDNVTFQVREGEIHALVGEERGGQINLDECFVRLVPSRKL